jgi:aryl-alcohol dehydrogenase-like predicted oxidoreductase
LGVKLGLGTVQFGLDYGVSNSDGRTPVNEARCILDYAASVGVQVLDTSPSYGVSEQVLGTVVGNRGPFKVVTKTRPRVASPDELRSDLQMSLCALSRSSVYGLLVHRSADLLSGNGAGLYAELVRLKEQGLVEKIGVSIYTASEIEALLDRYSIDLLQIPFNVLDQRLLIGGHLRRAKDLGIECHARSVFLQGLLLMSPESLTDRFNCLEDHLRNYRRFIAEHGFTPVSAALGFALQVPEIDVVLCGVNTLAQLEEIADVALENPTHVDAMEFGKFAIDNERLLNPSLWSADAT